MWSFYLNKSIASDSIDIVTLSFIYWGIQHLQFQCVVLLQMGFWWVSSDQMSFGTIWLSYLVSLKVLL